MDMKGCLVVYIIGICLMPFIKGKTIAELEKEINVLVTEDMQLRKEIRLLDPICSISNLDKCGPCRCRDSKNLLSKYYCDCQNLKPLRDCKAFRDSGTKVNGIYNINQNLNKVIQVYCDQTTDGGGWTVFQRRADGSVNFYRGWNDYKTGFGDLSNEFWLGNDNLYTLSLQALYPSRSELRIDMEDFSGVKRYAKYANFQIGDSFTNYKLHLSGYSGTASDRLIGHHNGQSFSTYDKDNDGYSGNCAYLYKSGWWYGDGCHISNLNGRYYFYKEAVHAMGVVWSDYSTSLKFVEMKVRRR